MNDRPGAAPILRRLLLVMLLVALGSPSVAAAATVRLSFFPASGHYADAYGVEVVGGPEADDVTVRLSGRTFDVTDATAPLSAIDDCVAVDEHHATCTMVRNATLQAVVVRGGAGNDRLTTIDTGSVTVLASEEGDDVLIGGEESDSLDGGPGRDELHGGGGNDVLAFKDGATAGELLDGGPGRDRIETGGLGAPAIVDLLAGRIQAAGGESAVTAVEDVDSRSDAPVTLRGDDGPNALRSFGPEPVVADGRGGGDSLEGSVAAADTLNGGAGSDSIVFSAGDRVDGGEGDDHLSGDSSDGLDAGARWRATITCGPGNDDVYAPHASLVPADCEHLLVPQVGSVALPRASRHAVIVGLTTYRPACGVQMSLSTNSGQALTATRRVRLVAEPGAMTLRLALTAAARRRSLPAQARLDLRPAAACGRARRWPLQDQQPLRVALRR